MSQRIFKPDYKAFRETIDLISGYDLFAYNLNKYISYSGYIKISPLHDRLVRDFGFPDSTAPEIKPYKAMWAIFDDELLLFYVNAEINNQVFYTTDLVPEYSDELVMYNYTLFSGILQLVVLDIEIKKPDIEFIDCESIMLFIHEGKLTNKILKPHKIRTSQSQPEIIEFRTKSPEQQIQTLLVEGVFLHETTSSGIKTRLYSMEHFFATITINPNSNSLPAVRSFANPDILDEYLNFFNFSDLI